jgi:hypothetical protein
MVIQFRDSTIFIRLNIYSNEGCDEIVNTTNTEKI